MSKYIGDVSTDTVSLEVYECKCGFHMGLDSTYIDQVGSIVIECPSCQSMIDTGGSYEEDQNNK